MPLAMMARGICSCGRAFVVFQPERRDMAERLSTDLEGMDWDVFVCDSPEAFCSKCGQGISLPTPEELDTDRHGMSSLSEWLESIENGSEKPGSSGSFEDLLDEDSV